MNMYRDLHVTNDFGQKLDLGTFLMLPPAEQHKMAEGKFNPYTLYKRKLNELTREQREEYERMFRARREYNTELMAREVRG
jgi:hypothetical protein